MYGKKGKCTRLRRMVMKVGRQSFALDLTHQEGFEDELPYVHDADVIVAKIVGDMFEFGWNSTVARHTCLQKALKGQSIQHVFDRTKEKETWMLMNQAELNKDDDLLDKVRMRSVKKKNQGWEVIYWFLNSKEENAMKTFVENSANVDAVMSGDWRGHRSSAVEAAVIKVFADALKKRRKIRIGRGPDLDPVVDFFIVEAKDATKAILEGNVPNFLYQGEVLGVQVKTFSGSEVRFMSKDELQHYGDVVFIHYDWPTARYLVVKENTLAGMAKLRAKKRRPSCVGQLPAGVDPDNADAPLSEAVCLDPRHPEGKKVWKKHGCASLLEAVAKLEQIFEASGNKKTFRDMFTTPEFEELSLLQTKLGSDGQVRLTEICQQLVDAFVKLTGKEAEARLQARARNVTVEHRGTRYQFVMGIDYEVDSFHLYLLTIRVKGEIKGQFLLPRQLLWKHRFFPGQTRRRSNTRNRDEVKNKTMMNIKIAWVRGGLKIPGLEEDPKVEPEIAEFMKEAAEYWFPVDGEYPGKTMADVVEESLEPLKEKDIVKRRDVKLTAKMIVDEDIKKPLYVYVLGKAGGDYAGNDWRGTHKPKYTGRNDFGLKDWTVKVNWRKGKKPPPGTKIAHETLDESYVDLLFFPPDYYFFKKGSGKEYAGWSNSSGSPYTKDPEAALALAEAYGRRRGGSVDAAMEQMMKEKPDLKVVRKLLAYAGDDYMGTPPDLPEEEGEEPAEPAEPEEEESEEEEPKRRPAPRNKPRNHAADIPDWDADTGRERKQRKRDAKKKQDGREAKKAAEEPSKKKK